MAVQYTNYFNFPLVDDGTGSWGAVINGVLIRLDTWLNGLQAKTPHILTHENEVLIHEGEVLKINDD